MSEWVIIAIGLAGFAAGVVNTVVGSGSLITYPVMVAFGIPPVAANVANTVGLVPGSIAGAWGYRTELGGIAPRRLGMLTAASAVGAILGAFLLTRLPARSFEFVIPVLILGAALLVAFQPRLARRVVATGGTRWVALGVAVGLAGVYGGYFSAAQGVILLGLFGVFMTGSLQQANALKNILQAVVNLVAALFFVLTGPVRWTAVAAVAIGSVVGALVGAWAGKRIPAKPLRLFIVIFGVVVAVIMAWRAIRPW